MGYRTMNFIMFLLQSYKVPMGNLTVQEEEAGLKLFDLNILKQTKNLENMLLPRFHEYYCTICDKIYSEGLE
mgnify:FL=1|tara:strand:+ start:491 stop:706 length:216 start_codon:yes stop_codon:yes gene_type:complete